MIIIYIIIFLVGVISYIRDKAYIYLVCIYLVISSCLDLLPLTHSSILYDIGMVMCIVPLLITKNTSGYNLFKDRIGKVIIYLLFYSFMVFLFTIILRVETPLYAIKVFRMILCIILYFTILRLKPNDVEKALAILFFLTLCCSILFIIWRVSGVDYSRTMLADKQSHIFVLYEVPSLAAFALAYALYNPSRSIKYFVYAIIILFSVVLAATRGLFIAMIVSIAIFYTKYNKNRKLLLFLCAIMILSYGIIGNYFEKEKGSAIKEIASVFKSGLKSNRNDGKNTFRFRLAIVDERISYMTENPLRFLTGVGTIHEKSPNNKFNFYTGSRNYDPNFGYYTQQLDTSDVGLISVFMRYGLIYIIIYAWLMINLIKTFNRSPDYYSIYGLFTLLVCLFVIPSSDFLSTLRYMFPVWLIAGMVTKRSLGKNQSIINSVR